MLCYMSGHYFGSKPQRGPYMQLPQDVWRYLIVDKVQGKKQGFAIMAIRPGEPRNGKSKR